jgi:hypothetical protein
LWPWQKKVCKALLAATVSAVSANRLEEKTADDEMTTICLFCAWGDVTYVVVWQSYSM